MEYVPAVISGLQPALIMEEVAMHRRQLLRSALGSTLLFSAGRLFAAAADSPRFLLVFLRGGYDCANFLVPYGSADYYSLRPHIAIARPDPAVANGALALDDQWALAPAIRDSVGTLYQQKQMALVPFAGTDDLSRSHFETQDSIELGQALTGQRDLRSGFLARLVAVLSGPAPIAFTEGLPLVFQGPGNIPNVSLKSIGKPVFDARQSAILSAMYQGSKLEPAVTEGLELRQSVSQSMADEMQAANRGAVTTKGFELEAERMARLMRDTYRLGFVDVGGWDTHVNETGALASNLQSLGNGLVRFANGLGAAWKDTVVVVLSEFGRTFRENGNQGTDHGHGSVYWVLGGSINGGRIAGEQIVVSAANLFQQRDYPVLNGYREMLGGIFARMWGLSRAQLERVLPGAPPRDLQLV
jgi:uncharacterized protein (DUF1501 family)